MSYQVVIPVIIAFVISAALAPVVIPFLRKLKVGQTERKELESHQKKMGTPTMGGIIILAAVVVTSLIYIKDYPKIVPILFLTVGFGIIGFLDDYLKVVLRRSDGLLAWQKMILQIVVTAVFAVYMIKVSGVSLEMLIPFSGGKYLDLGWVAVPLLFFAVIGTVNGVNFTDGLDGLASSVTVHGCDVLQRCGGWNPRAGSSRSPARLSAHCLAFYCLMFIRQAFLWEIPDLWRSADLLRELRICCRCRCLS